MTKEDLKKQIEKAAEAHAKEILGEKQYKENQSASKAIKDDFISGATWMYNFKKYNVNHA